jgi:hypothetical protein
VGPESLGKEAQSKVHQIRGANIPQGWENQIRTEPGIAIKYDRLWLYRNSNGARSADLIPQAGISLGNINTYAHAGFTLRVGYNAPEDFGTGTIDSPSAEQSAGKYKWGAYIFTGLDGRLVGYNISLDGNTYRGSHNVDKYWAVADLKFGGALVLKRFELSYTFVFRTKEFKTQHGHDEFGSVALKMKF